MTRKQILAEIGITEEQARRFERVAAMSEAEFNAEIKRRRRQICTSTKIPSGRGLSRKTFALRAPIMAAFEETDKPVTVRQMFYMLTVRGAVEKQETGYRKAQRQLVLMRREGEVPYSWLADNTRWMRKPTTYAGLGDFFDRAAAYYRQDLWVRSDVYVEVWCEKDALAGVLMPVTSEYDVPLMVSARLLVGDLRLIAAEFGNGTESVELDAIHPDLLRSLVRDAIEQHIDHGGLETLRREEDAAREALQELAQAGFD